MSACPCEAHPEWAAHRWHGTDPRGGESALRCVAGAGHDWRWNTHVAAVGERADARRWGGEEERPGERRWQVPWQGWPSRVVRAKREDGPLRWAGTMPMPTAPLVLFKMWLAKKAAVLIAIRIYGMKKLYRGGLRLNNKYVTDESTRKTIHSVLHKVAAGAMKLSDTVEGPARRFMNKIVFGDSPPGGHPKL